MKPTDELVEEFLHKSYAEDLIYNHYLIENGKLVIRFRYSSGDYLAREEYEMLDYITFIFNKLSKEI
jgi:hypothetical protein